MKENLAKNDDEKSSDFEFKSKNNPLDNLGALLEESEDNQSERSERGGL